MHVTAVSLRPTPQADEAGRPALTPELLAASGARYSRNNEGLNAILARIDPDDLDRSVDSIFKMLDYGHQSIADMAPVAMFLDDISIWLAYYTWTLCPVAGGQESSTRYIELHADSVVRPEVMGIGGDSGWETAMAELFVAYEQALAAWARVGKACPGQTGIPKSLFASTEPRDMRTRDRMLRNFRFDRARVYLPAAALTNMMLVMSARAWANLCQHLCSHPLHEAQQLGAAIRDELALSAPRLLKHASAQPWFERGLRDELARAQREAAAPCPHLTREAASSECPPAPFLRTLPPAEGRLAEDLAHHENRYAWIGPDLRRMAVNYGWDAVALAEIRDLNRHRTGARHCPLVPCGFYGALDQLPDNRTPDGQAIQSLATIGQRWTARARELLAAGDPTYVYWLPIGAQFRFERTTTADKMIYEAELRTGLGAHYRYAKHYHELLELWYELYPETRGLIIEGEAEPE